MSKKRTKSTRKTTTKSKKSGVSKVVKHQLSCILPVSEQTNTEEITTYFQQSQFPATLILVGKQEAEAESQHNIKWVNSDWVDQQNAFRLGYESIEHETGFVCFLQESCTEYLVPAIRWFYARNIKKTSKLALIGTFGKSKTLNNLVHQVWSPLGSQKPLAHINFCTIDVAQNLLNESSTHRLAIEQTRFLKQQPISFLEMPIDLDTGKSIVTEKLSLIGLNIKLLFQDFWHAPIKSIKRTSNLLFDLKKGNHPLYRMLFAAVFLFFLVLMPLVSFDYGITWDEPVNIEYAEDIYNYYRTGGEDQMVFDQQKRHARNATMHYGASFDFFAFLVQKHISPFGVYETRHLLNAIVGVLIALFVGRIGKEFGNWRIACFALLFILLSPRFFGHSMNNHKDIPFMLGYAMGIYYMIRFIRQLPNPRISTMFWLSIGMAYGISIRIGGLLIIAYFVMFFGLSWLGLLFDKANLAVKRLPKYLLYGLAIVFASYMLGIVFWPYGIEKPFTNPFLSLSQFTNFKFLTTYEVFDGQRMLMENPPWNYIPQWIWISVPLFVLVGLFLSLPHIVHKFKQHDKLVLSMLLFTAIFPVAYVIYKESTLYSGWRHVLFIYAPLVVIAAFGWEYLFQLSTKKLVHGVVAASLIALMALPSYWMVKNHPNQYVYFNELTGGINGAYTNYETEYWCNGAKQAVEWLIENEPVKDRKIVIATNFEINSSQYYANKLTDSVQVIWCRENQKYLVNWDYAIFGSRTLSKEAIINTFPPKGTIHMIKADTVPLVAIVKRENSALYEAFSLQKKRQLRPALAKVHEALDYEPTNLEALRLKATLHLNLGQYDSALIPLEKCVLLNPDDYAAYTLMGTSYRVKKQLDKGLEVLNNAQQLRVNNAGLYHERGLIYAKKENFQAAYKNFDQALKYSQYKNPNMIFDVSRVQIQHGQAAVKNKQDPQSIKKKEERFRAAIKNLNRVLQLRPTDRRAINNLAYTYLQLKDTVNYRKYSAMLQKK